ncbi:multicopper oxidase family protein [Candidatus Methylocalor cossyra]|uniref:Multicopper oxidase n=1 Tax=Candidatus Methylocalor cossyra TaxID=3108543 RepID=A0ABM9NMM8_9GAMM
MPVVNLKDGDVFEMLLTPVKKKINGRWVRMLSYNKAIPGPVLRVSQGSEVVLRLRNRGDTETSLHAHGLRLENAFDGVPGVTQKAQRIGETREYRLRFPDPGVYWYHPHVRVDYALASGLYGTIVVTPSDADYWPRVNREMVMMLSDIALDPLGDRIPFFKGIVDHALMGRFGNVLLLNGEPSPRFSVQRGETVRLYLTNAANARVFNLAIPGARMKLIGTGMGRYAQESWIDSVVLAPGERRIVDVLFERSGNHVLQHRTHDEIHPLGIVSVGGRVADRSLAQTFTALRGKGEVGNPMALKAILGKPPDKVLKLTMAMDPKLMRASDGSHAEGHRMADGMAMHHPKAVGPDKPDDGIEWEDAMPSMNRASTSETVVWKLVDGATGEEGMAIRTWQFVRGDLVKIRLVNESTAMHPMYHPIHFHGQRFRVLAMNGVSNENDVWQDTVLVPRGATVDILLEASNPGSWVAHCHIAEHGQSGMMLPFQVKPHR